MSVSYVTCVHALQIVVLKDAGESVHSTCYKVTSRNLQRLENRP